MTSLMSIVVGLLALSSAALGLDRVRPQTSMEVDSPVFTKYSGPVDDTSCDYSTVDALIQTINPDLERLLTQKDFRYFIVNLHQQCPFWNEDSYCFQKDCAVETVDDEELIPKEWRATYLSKVDFTSANQLELSSPKCSHIESDFCMLDDVSSADAVYVDLVNNPERFTGYSGASSERIWKTIYNENCFNFIGTRSPTLDGEINQSLCLEKRVFYKIISGLHSSISTHICDINFNKTSGEWYSDLNCFMKRVGNYRDRVSNVYFTHIILSHAIKKIGSYLISYPFCSDESDETSQLLERVVNEISKIDTFNEASMFSDYEAMSLKQEFKSRFKNISRIMDCVGCEKCRLWGKLQISGIATALKVIFPVNDKSTSLTRPEMVALVNVFGRISSSLTAFKKFEKILKKQSEYMELKRNDEAARKVVNKELVILFSTVCGLLLAFKLYTMVSVKSNPNERKTR